MNRNRLRQYRVARKLMLILAAAPLFQLAQCGTFGGTLGRNFANSLPSLFFNTIQGLALGPLQVLLAALFGQTPAGTI